jgi:cyclopropane-fatty-acyl-phospholipid synthase
VGDLRIRVHLPGGKIIGAGGFGDPVMRIVRPDEFYARIGADGLIGFGEAWTTGAWDAQDPASVLTVFAGRVDRLVPRSLQRLRRWVVPVMPGHQTADLRGARTNAEHHYDLSNELFSLFLDRTMTYSSALFEPGDDLEAGQLRKIDAILDAAGVKEGTRVLEIGTGWGELAVRAAGRGASVTTVTLSVEQQHAALRKTAERGVADRVAVLLQDYREVEGEFDAVVSVEMVEAVGESYFRAIDRVLAPEGRVAVQAITMADERMLATRHTRTWIHKYIFPGGLIPSPEAIDRTLQTYTDLRVVQRRDFGPHYAETLRLWRERFLAKIESVADLGFDDRFRRMWEFYLAYCEAGFRSGYLDVAQFTLARTLR